MTNMPPISDAIAAVRDAITWHLPRTETDASQRLLQLRAALDYLSDHERVVAELDELRASHNGHNEPCVICGEPINSLTGNPGLWPVRLGNDGWRHVMCVNKALAERDAARAELATCQAALSETAGNLTVRAKELAEARAAIDHLKGGDDERTSIHDRGITNFSGNGHRDSATRTWTDLTVLPPEDALEAAHIIATAAEGHFGIIHQPANSQTRLLTTLGCILVNWPPITQALIAAREAEREKYLAAHEARVSELLEANNREVERRRAAESKLAQLAEPDEDFIECVERHLRPINPLHDSVVRAVVRAIAEVLS